MKIAQSLIIGVVALAGAVSAPLAQTADAHKIILPDEIIWGRAPASMPPGAQVAPLYGDATKEGIFALRIKMPRGYHVPPHTHPKPEIVTVISGKIRLGTGEKADESKSQALPAGSLVVVPPDTLSYIFVEEDAIVQLNSVGPWGISYHNPKDDPRHKTQ